MQTPICIRMFSLNKLGIHSLPLTFQCVKEDLFKHEALVSSKVFVVAPYHNLLIAQRDASFWKQYYWNVVNIEVEIANPEDKLH